MEDDKFGDPRTRAKRGRGRGGRGRGRGRGASQAASTVSKKKPDLGTNAYRFERDEGSGRDDEEDAYEAGVDFEEIAEAAAITASGGDAAVQIADAQELPDDVLSELVVDFSMLDSVLAGAPLWVRLGEDARFALGVPAELGWDDVVDGFDEDEDEGGGEDGGDGKNGGDAVASKGETGLLGDIAALELEDDDDEADGTGSEGDVQTKGSKGVADGEDDFDKWLDDL